MMMDEDVPEEEDVDSTTAIEGNNEERASGSHDEDRNNAATNAAAVSTSTTTTTTAPSKEQKRRRRALKPRRRDSKAPRPPRTALELYQVDSRKDFIRKHGAASIPKDFAAQKAASFERLSFQTIQQWKVAEAEDLVRYQRQLQHYHPPPGYDPFGNLIVEDDDDDEDSEANTKKQKVNDSSATANATTISSILDAPGDPSKVSATPSPHLTLATASFTDLTYELTKFRIKKGHCRVPLKRGGILGKWVDRLRKEYRKIRGNDSIIMPSQSLPDNVRLTEERIQVLSHLGMVWEFPNEDYEEIWQNHFRQLVEFKEKNGHCNVPQKGHGKLSWWVKIQRELFVNSTQDHDSLAPRSRPRQTMPQHRIRQLESIGFEWRVRPPAMKWEDRYHELLDYKAAFGDCNVPQNYPANRVLGKWVMKQRGFYYDKLRGRKSPLTEERQKKLQEVGFAWVAPHVCKTKTKLPFREDIVQEHAAKASAESDDDATEPEMEADGEGNQQNDADDGHGEPAPIQRRQQQRSHHPPLPPPLQARNEQFSLPLQPHVPTLDEPTQTYRAFPGTHDPATPDPGAPHAPDPTNMYHQPPLETAAAMRHLTTDPDHHETHLAHQHSRHRHGQQQEYHPHHQIHAPPPQQHLQYSTASQVAVATYPYVANHQPQEQPRAAQLDLQEQQRQETRHSDEPTATGGYYPPL